MINRHCRQGETGLEQVLERFAERGIAVAQIQAEGAQQAAAEIRKRAAEFDLLVIGGGDGTLRSAAAAVVDSGLPVGILPLGTANDLARALGIPADPLAAVDIIAAGETHRIDVGRVNGHYFFNAAHIGLGATVTDHVSSDRKRSWGVLGYARSLLEAWRSARPFIAELDCDGEIHYLRTLQITVGNGRFFGGGMTVHEEALLDDQLLDVYSIRPQSLWQIAAMLPALRAGKHRQLDEVASFRGRRIVIRTRKPRPVTADEEPITQTPAVFEVVPAAVTVYVGQREARQAEGLDRAAQ